MAGDRHRLPRHLALQRRTGDPGEIMTSPSASQVTPAGEDTRPSQHGRAGPRGQSRRRAAVAAVLRRHWLAAALLAAGLVLRLLAQLAYRPALFYIDTTRYLYNDAPGMDPVGYKGPLRAILA